MLSASELRDARILTDNAYDPAFAGVLAAWRAKWGAPATPLAYDPAAANRLRMELRGFIDDAWRMRSIRDAEHPTHDENLERWRQLLGAIAP